MGGCLSNPQGPHISKGFQESRSKVFSEIFASAVSFTESKKLGKLITHRGKLMDDYSLGAAIGRGQFGVISVCTHRKSGKEFACKTISLKNLNTEDSMQSIRNEIMILQTLKGHPHIVKVEAVYEDTSSVHIVMEHCSGGPLTDHISQQGEYSERAAADILRVMMQVLDFCHSKGVVHRDLKLCNFLLSDDTDGASLKAIDFGASVVLQKGEKINTMAGSPMYMAPEVLDGSYDFKCDVWSSGCILYALLNGNPPFSGDSVLRVFEAIKSAPLDLESEPWPLVSESAKGLIRMMLERDTNKRPTPAQVLAHPWLKVGTADASLQQPSVSLASVMLPRMKKYSAMSKLRHIARLIATQYMAPSQMEELRVVFDAVDVDKSGGLSFSELKDALTRIGALMSDKDIEEIFSFSDVDGNGVVDYSEFVAATMVMKKSDSSSAIREAFEEIDEDNSGFITVDEFALVCEKYKAGDKKAISRMIQEANLPYVEDGKIDYNGFVSFILGDCSNHGGHSGFNLLLMM